MYRQSVLKRLPNLLILDNKEIAQEERERVENQMMPDAKITPMIHYSQYPSSKVPVKLNAVNFDGVFNNMKSFSEQPSPNVAKQPTGSSRGNRQGDMANLIQVSSMQTKFMD